ncbi:RNA polymerase ECF-type sigma factor [Candidatus Protofrankia californiensis]|uniref:RNA polymerase ECF-type sigma factor n=1 Tax=Candidatus Protofrankia californiensis TaxID=1839754 RepID=A0A1C3PBA3_9ACTN|nr:RNA polymerase ECF-type sigma factor [Candidatus Protofrankia californiensis]
MASTSLIVHIRCTRKSSPRSEPYLTRRFGDLDLAEEAAAEAFVTAVERWPADGVPPNPGAWLTTTANRKAIDRIRRENKRDDKHKEAQLLHDDDVPEPLGAIDDERLRLIFTCCYPALGIQARVALTLRMVGGEFLEDSAADQIALQEGGLVDIVDERRRGDRGFDHVDEVELVTPHKGPEPPRAPGRG